MKVVTADGSRRRHIKGRWQLDNWFGGDLCHFVFWSNVTAAGGHILCKKLYVIAYVFVSDW